MKPSQTIREPLLRELVKVSAVRLATIRGFATGFEVIVNVGDQEKVLETVRGEKRLFASLDTAASLVRDIGLPRFEVDMTEYQPGRLRKARPDRSEALKRTRTRLTQQILGI